MFKGTFYIFKNHFPVFSRLEVLQFKDSWGHQTIFFLLSPYSAIIQKTLIESSFIAFLLFVFVRYRSLLYVYSLKF